MDRREEYIICDQKFICSGATIYCNLRDFQDCSYYVKLESLTEEDLEMARKYGDNLIK